MPFQTHHENSSSTVELWGEMDIIQTLPELEIKMDEIIENGTIKIILDMTKVSYYNSAFLSFLTVYFRKIQHLGGELLFIPPQNDIFGLLELSEVLEISKMVTSL